MVRLLTTEERLSLHHRYKQGDLYRQWSPILSMLERDYGEMDGVTLWSVAERLITRLRGERAFREQEIPVMYNELLGDCRVFSRRSADDAARTEPLARRSAGTVLCVVLTMLMNAVEGGHEDEPFGNEPMCRAVLDVLGNDAFPQSLMKIFFGRKTGYDGAQVVIAPSDPMSQEFALEGMDDVAKGEVDAMVAGVLEHTRGLRACFKKHWQAWEDTWRGICLDTELMVLLKEVSPRNNEWGMNQKMIANVAGMFNAQTRSDATAKGINDALAGKNLRPYISNHADYGHTNAAFSQEQHKRVKGVIEACLLAKDVEP